jgi:hypothetical protein
MTADKQSRCSPDATSSFLGLNRKTDEDSTKLEAEYAVRPGWAGQRYGH